MSWFNNDTSVHPHLLNLLPIPCLRFVLVGKITLETGLGVISGVALSRNATLSGENVALRDRKRLDLTNHCVLHLVVQFSAPHWSCTLQQCPHVSFNIESLLPLVIYMSTVDISG